MGKEDLLWQISTESNAQQYSSWEKFRLKSQWDTSTHPLEWPKHNKN